MKTSQASTSHDSTCYGTRQADTRPEGTRHADTQDGDTQDADTRHEGTGSALRDSHQRLASYLRLSVTDRCNLRCSYCRSGAESFISHQDILRYEELLDLVGLAVDMGIEKVRVTGGEPFARKGLVPFLETMRSNHPALDIRLTTNATLMGPYIPALAALGINAVNVSIDTFKPDRYAQTTGRGLLLRVLENIDALQNAGVRVKLNAVAMRGVNSDELPDFLAFARARDLDVRFIEFMPMGEGTLWNSSLFWSADDILAEARALVNLTPVPQLADDATENSGPASMYTMEGGGRLGLITPLSNHFCGLCNRLRVTSDGRLRTCLFDDREFRIRAALRHPRLGLEHIRRILLAATLRKPIGADILRQRTNEVAKRRMNAIGG